MKPTKDEIDKLVTDYAYGIAKYLRDIGCVREADNVEPVWACTEDMCESVGAPEILWPSIREKMLSLGMPLSLQYFGGYYMGNEGEEVTLLLHKKSMIKGLAESFNRDFIIMSKAGTLEDAKNMGEKRFGVGLNDVPKMLRALGNPLPAQLEKLLIEANVK